jgi:hypothetical protein
VQVLLVIVQIEAALARGEKGASGPRSLGIAKLKCLVQITMTKEEPPPFDFCTPNFLHLLGDNAT